MGDMCHDLSSSPRLDMEKNTVLDTNWSTRGIDKLILSYGIVCSFTPEFVDLGDFAPRAVGIQGSS